MNCCVMYCKETGRRSSAWYRIWVLKFTGFKVGGGVEGGCRRCTSRRFEDRAINKLVNCSVAQD